MNNTTTSKTAISSPERVNQSPEVFTFGSHEVRTLDMGGEVWFVAADVCEVLGHAHQASALRRLDCDEKGVHTMHTLGGPQEMTVISEPGLYRITLTSRKAEAKRFTRWVTHEVLPAIRRNGRYEAAPGRLRARLLLSMEGSEVVSSTPVSNTACLVEPSSRISVETLVREFIPRHMLSVVLGAIADRLGCQQA